MLHLGILETGHNSDALAKDFGRFSDLFANWLDAHRSEFAFTLSAYHVEGGELPASVEACDGYIITGSAAGVYEDHEWLEPARQFIRDAMSARKRLLGVCFGHQLIADVLGGRVEKSSKGWGIGRHHYRLLDFEPWMEAATDDLLLLACHQDQIVEPPPGARVLATSEFCEYAMLAIGDDVITVQAHPEFTPEYASALYGSRRERFGDETTDRGLSTAAEPTDADVFARWALTFMAGSSSGSESAVSSRGVQ